MHGYPDFGYVGQRPIFGKDVRSYTRNALTGRAILVNNTTNIFEVIHFVAREELANIDQINIHARETGGSDYYMIDGCTNLGAWQCLYIARPVFLLPGWEIAVQLYYTVGSNLLGCHYGYTQHEI